MADENTDPNTTADPVVDTPAADSGDLDKKIQEAVDAQLASIKSKLDSAYAQRDEALVKLKTKEQAEHEAELKRLEDEGKHKERFELLMAEANAANKALEAENLKLKRDTQVTAAMQTVSLRNDAAQEMAAATITKNLVQDSNGNWVSKDGKSIKDYVKTFFDDESNAFLLKPKVSRGSGTSSLQPQVDEPSTRPLFERSQADVLKDVQEGRLKRTKPT
jgi:hypothetical protein